ncbi:MAG: DUF3566 domain-containing protein [Candidatus Actinomarinales bacterium]|nr:MAG: DUF3566 domain-containing protein [Candidatus Actinomarinales bacterium]|tara:strand:+ start:2192 stop:2794 length:603 start_codon:yes stop_codon:yes gene_type:complete
MVRVNRVRRIIRKVDPWTVLKVTFVLNFVVALTIVLGFCILWVLLINAGVPQGLEDIARRLALLDENASLVGNIEALFSSVVFLATVYLLTQTALATIGAFFYNLVSDLVGGIEVVVLEESYGEETVIKQRRTKKEKDENKETVFMTLSRTVKKMRDERNKEKNETAYPEMPRPDVPRDIEEQTLSESFKNISNEEDEQK